MSRRSPEVERSDEEHQESHGNHGNEGWESSFLEFEDSRQNISQIQMAGRRVVTYPNPSAVSRVFRKIAIPNLSSKWWNARLYNLNILFPSLPLRLAGAFAASTGSDMKLRFSLRLEYSVQSGICGCRSVRRNLTAPAGGVWFRGERGTRPSELTEVVNGELGVREESCAFKSFSMNGVGPPAPAQKSTYVYVVTLSPRVR